MKSLIEPNDPTTEFLKRHLGRKGMPSSFLFSGAGGERKRKVARDFAKALNCLKTRAFESCECESCQKIEAGNHPDVRWYGLDEDERSIKIEAVRDLQNWLGLKPYEGKSKVFILNEANRLTTDAQNALLKSLEEPPPQSVLILLAQKKADLLDTVVSRLTEIKVTPYPEKEAIQMLASSGFPENDVRFLLRFSSGDVEQARQLAESGTFKQNREALQSVLNDPINGFEKLTTRPRKEVLEFLTVLLAWIRDASFEKVSCEPSLLLDQNNQKTLQLFTSHQSLESIICLAEAVEETRKAMEENVNQKLALARLQVIWKSLAQ